MVTVLIEEAKSRLTNAITQVLKLGRVSHVKSKGNHWYVHAHHPSYFQIKAVIEHSCNVHPQLQALMFLMYKNCIPPPFEWTENQISFHRTTWTVDSNCGGKESYTKTLKPKSKGWMLQLGKTGYIVRSGRVIGDLWYRWHVLDRSRPILFELQDLCGRRFKKDFSFQFL